MGQSSTAIKKADGENNELKSFSVGIGKSIPIGKVLKGLGTAGEIAVKVIDNVSIGFEKVFTKFWEVKKEELNEK